MTNETQNSTAFKPGLYRHYKGGLYRALFVAAHHESDELLVAYMSFDHPESGIRLREWASAGKDSWTDMVHVPVAGDVRRFTWVGP